MNKKQEYEVKHIIHKSRIGMTRWEWAREASGERDFCANTERKRGSLREENSHRERHLWDKPWPVGEKQQGQCGRKGENKGESRR